MRKQIIFANLLCHKLVTGREKFNGEKGGGCKNMVSKKWVPNMVSKGKKESQIWSQLWLLLLRPPFFFHDQF